MTAATAADTVLLIHGACAEPMGWEHWMSRYASRGYTVIATAVPSERGRDGCLDWYVDARARSAAIAVADYYTHLLRAMPAPPVLIGHCFGGLIVQLLVDRGMGAAAVLLNTPPAPVRESPGFPPCAGSDTAGPTVDYRSRWRAPLLVVAGGRDRHVLPEMSAAAVLRYQSSDAVTGFLEYPDACHHVLRAPGWEYVADDVLDWAMLHTDPEASPGTGRRGR